MAVEIISWSISTTVWDKAHIQLATPGSAARQVSAVRQVRQCYMDQLIFLAATGERKFVLQHVGSALLKYLKGFINKINEV